MSKVIYCIWCYDKNFDEAKVCIERVQAGVDAVCVVGNKLNDEQVKWLEDRGCKVKLQPFRDNFLEQRNTYLNMARELENEPWVLVSDPDELFNEALVKDLKKMIPSLEEKGYNAAGINCREEFKDVELLDEADLRSYPQATYEEIFKEGRESTFFKLLLFKVYADTFYAGVGGMKVLHETWQSPTHPIKAVYLPKKYKYHHRKSALALWRNASRNVFLAGGGNSVGSMNPAWVELRRICREKLGIIRWEEFDKYLRKGNVDKELLDWIQNNMVNNGIDYVSETTQIPKYYFALHLDEWEKLGKPKVKFEVSKKAQAEYAVTRAYLTVLGRHPDEAGKKHYADLILAGKIKAEDITKILARSPEYRQKFGMIKTVEGEKIRIQVPVDVDVHISEDLFRRALANSKLYWNKIKPKLDLGEFIESFAAKADFYAWFYKSKTEGSLTPEAMIERLKNGKKVEEACSIGRHIQIKEQKITQDHFRYWIPEDDDIYVDVGAWVGDVIEKLMQFKKNVRVIAIEPRPSGVKKIRDRFQKKLGENLVVLCKGVSDKKGKAIFGYYPNRNGKIVTEEEYRHYLKEGISPDKFMEIETDTLDNILKELGIKEVDFAKIDTEGHELQVLEGFTKFKRGTKFHVEFHYGEAERVLELLDKKRIKVIEMIYWKIATEPYGAFGEIWAEAEE